MKGFSLNEVCTTEKGARFIVTSQDDFFVEIHDFDETTYRGIQLMPEGYSSDEVVVSENRLFLNGYEVMNYGTYVERWSSLSNYIPRYYVIRKYDGDYYRFVGGFDFLDDGRAWEGITRTEYPTIADALQFVRERVGDDFTIWLEEPLRI